ncbi:hypothetical protein COU79_03815 [Candidatus Peregrinibacteria bacterium CG10_big_fil_rev_8_21_14_0_10_54_7]|nr:MAG: hypothetical protein COU79_03815 [Candidatus Peregrinibacteria bacterium CG10_big_fil_rev_8_21_14_0_10_54_7]
MARVSLKVPGAQGQGVNSVGEICGKGLKRAGYCVFGYREYMSLIKGGHSSYQLDISNEKIESTETRADIVMNFDHHGLTENFYDVKDGGILLHQTPMWKFTEEQQKFLKEHAVTVVYLPVEEVLRKLRASPILGNIYITAVVWALLGQGADALKELVREQFGHKGEEIIRKNYEVIDEAVAYISRQEAVHPLALMKPDVKWRNHLYLTGSQAMGLGIIHAGCRLYASYPMTPASPLLTYIADMQNKTGMVIKQAEDEITAAQVVSGAMLMGTRAATATSGGGFDLMTETLSLNGLLENPFVVFLFQRPGPATGLPTWTAQGDLLLATGCAHGEFPRLVMAVSGSQDAFDLMPEAFNYAEEFQTVVIVLSDKQIAEGLSTQSPYDQKRAEIRRGKLITSPKALAKLTAADRYDPKAVDGLSPRWLPGTQAATFCSQGDEHDAEGKVNESGPNAAEQMEKRMAKVEALRKALPEPELYGSQNPEVLVVSWGSNRGPLSDVLKSDAFTGRKVSYLHYSYLWPLKTEKLMKLAKKAKKTVLVECNYQGQLGMLIAQECGLHFDHRILKYDGRPMFFDELFEQLTALLP